MDDREREDSGTDGPSTSPLKCSAVMCTFNGLRHLDEQLASLAAQSRPLDELVICDDHSTDGTWEAVREFARDSGIPTVIRRSESNVGYVRNFAEAVRLATGDVVFLCDQDDVWDQRKIAAFEDVFQSDPDVGLVFSDAELIDDSGRPIGQRAWQRRIVDFTPEQRRAWLSRPSAAVERLMRGYVVTGATMALRSRYLPLVLPVPSNAWTHDAWMAIVIAGVAPTVPLSESYTLYRLHPGQALGLEDPPGDLLLHRDEILRGRRTQLQLVSDRLKEHADRFPPIDGSVSVIDDMIDHLGKRVDITGSFLQRAPAVWRELQRGRYGRYSSGPRSAMSDLFPSARKRFAAASGRLSR